MSVEKRFSSLIKLTLQFGILWNAQIRPRGLNRTLQRVWPPVLVSSVPHAKLLYGYVFTSFTASSLQLQGRWFSHHWCRTAWRSWVWVPAEALSSCLCGFLFTEETLWMCGRRWLVEKRHGEAGSKRWCGVRLVSSSVFSVSDWATSLTLGPGTALWSIKLIFFWLVTPLKRWVGLLWLRWP